VDAWHRRHQQRRAGNHSPAHHRTETAPGHVISRRSNATPAGGIRCRT
jgi:hypothetical protein